MDCDHDFDEKFMIAGSNILNWTVHNCVDESPYAIYSIDEVSTSLTFGLFYKMITSKY